MTSDLQRIWRKWLFYRNLLMAFFVLNVFCVVSGFVLSFNYWGFKQDLRERHEAELQRLAATAGLERQITNLENLLQKSVRPERAALVQELEEWRQLESQLEQSGLESRFPIIKDYYLHADQGRAFLAEIKSVLGSEREATFAQLKDMVNRYSNTTHELVVIAALTLLFGLIIPGFLFWMIGRLLRRTLEQMRVVAREIVEEWLRQSQKYGGDAFRNVEFWVEVLLIAAQFSGRNARHPMAQLAGEMAQLLRSEFNKIRTSSAA